MTFRIFLVLFLVVSGGTVAFLWMANAEAVDRLKMDINGLAPNVAVLEDRIAEQKELVRLRVNGNAAATKIAAATVERDQLVQEVQQISQDTAGMKAAMERAILEIRQRSVGMMLPEVHLPNRVPLKNAEIQGITAEGVRFKHADGITVAVLGDLPTTLQERFRFDELPLESTESGPRSMASAPKVDAGAKHEEKVKVLRDLITRYTHEQEDLNSRWSRIQDVTQENNNTSNRYKAEAARKQLYAQYVAAQDRLKAALRELQRLEANPPRSGN